MFYCKQDLNLVVKVIKESKRIGNNFSNRSRKTEFLMASVPKDKVWEDRAVSENNHNNAIPCKVVVNLNRIDTLNFGDFCFFPFIYLSNNILIYVSITFVSKCQCCVSLSLGFKRILLCEDGIFFFFFFVKVSK